MRAGLVLLVVGLAAPAACVGDRARPAGAGAEWAVGTTPIVTIGATEADPGQELAQVTGARWAGGRIIVANSASNELRVFDSGGKLLAATGRKGQGPGEFAGVIYLFPAAGDSLYSFDAGNLRWSLHDGAGRFVRVLEGGAAALPRPAWLHHRALVESNPHDAVPAWVPALLDGLPEGGRPAPVRRARVDDLGYLWVSDSIASNRWLVYDDSGPPIGEVALPQGFAMMQAGADFVLGVVRDAMDRELVRAYRLRRPEALRPPASAPPVRPPARDSALEGRMVADLSSLLVAQEIFYSNHASYTAAADSLTASPKSGAEPALLTGDKRHWAGILFDRKTKTTCGVAVGFPAPAGWIDGTPVCER